MSGEKNTKDNNLNPDDGAALLFAFSVRSLMSCKNALLTNSSFGLIDIARNYKIKRSVKFF